MLSTSVFTMGGSGGGRALWRLVERAAAAFAVAGDRRVDEIAVARGDGGVRVRSVQQWGAE